MLLGHQARAEHKKDAREAAEQFFTKGHALSGMPCWRQGAVGLTGGEWSPTWQVTKSTKCVYLLRRLAEIGAAPLDKCCEAWSQVRGIKQQASCQTAGLCTAP